jgi:hypothetical protein
MPISESFKLFPFQQEAVDKLWYVSSCLIGDEMGT